MSNHDRVHDREILDCIETLDPTPFFGEGWRVARSGRDPLRGSTANGRWGAAGEFEVLYVACDHDGALAEVGYRASLHPVWPSSYRHEIHKIQIALDRVLDLTDFSLLAKLGIYEDGYENSRYQPEQAVSAAARFLEFQGILVPNARYPGNNLVIYPDGDGVLAGLVCVDSQPVDWNAWRSTNRKRPSRRR